MKVKKKDKFMAMLGNIYFFRGFILFISLAIVALIIITPVYFFLNSISYDFFMKYIKRPIKQDEMLSLVDIDNNTITSQYIPSYPIPRYIYGDALEVFADFGAKAVVFDISFHDKSSSAINMNDIKYSLQTNLTSIKKNFADSIKLGNTSFSNEKFNKTLTGSFSKIEKDLVDATEKNDLYFAERIKYYGKTYSIINMDYDPQLEEKDLKPEEREKIKNNLAKYGYDKKLLLKNKKSHPAIKMQNIADFPVDPVLAECSGIGFDKTERDLDGAIRSISLFLEKDGYVFPQLALKPFIDIYKIKPEQMDFSSDNYVVFRKVKISDTKIVDISIPIFENKMIVNWPGDSKHGKFDDIFISNTEKVKEKGEKPQHFSLKYLLYYKYDLLKNLSLNLENFSNFAEIVPDAKIFYEEYQALNKAKNDELEGITSTDKFPEIFSQAFDDYLNRLISFTNEENIVKKEKKIDNGIKSENKTAVEIEDLNNVKKELRKIFTEIRKSAENVSIARDVLKKNLNNKICFVGVTATGSTDIGKTPFDEKFLNVGTHPSVFNNLVQNDFIYIVPNWAIFILTIVFFALIVSFLGRRKASVIASISFISIVVFLFLIGIFYRLTNIYISPIIPLLYGLSTAITMLVIEYIISERDKSFIKNTFSRYLSPIVIGELLKDPDKIELRGEKRNCTAVFTDIESFSSISERFMEDPQGLVALLNQYLSAMSDVILDNGGTIDKYEGDAIISFFGAPLDMPDHPYKACMSSIKMKQIEKELNEKLMQQKIIEKPLKTRIGINTGDMFVGNMGTSKRLDYTMMGHNVNLAARIEGVNKQYGTYQMLSEATYEKIKDVIVCRELDRVRVVNIKTPIRLYEPFNEKSSLNSEMLEFIEIFHNGLREFEKLNWKNALKFFEKAKSLRPDDAPTIVYIDRCNKFIKMPPPSGWDGIYNLSVK
jgi:adenylate cyclase